MEDVLRLNRNVQLEKHRKGYDDVYETRNEGEERMSYGLTMLEDRDCCANCANKNHKTEKRCPIEDSEKRELNPAGIRARNMICTEWRRR